MLGINFNHPDSVFYEKYRRQLAATLTVNLLLLSYGIGIGWAAPMLLSLQSSDSPLIFKISLEEAGSIGAYAIVGGLIGNILFGTILDYIGRKKSLFLLAVPLICSWVMVFFASDVYFLYIARTLLGISGGGLFICIPIFVAEIADSKIRGALAAVFGFALSVGLFLGNIIASHIAYLVIPCIVLIPAVLFLFFIVQFPETPQHLLRKEQSDKAEISLKFYTNTKRNNIEDELQFKTNFIEMKTGIVSSKDQQSLSLKNICCLRSMKALLIGIVLMFVYGCSGIYAILCYSSIIFAEINSALDPNTNTIIIGAFQIVGACCSFILVDRFGRKLLLIMSTTGMCAGYTILGLYSYLETEIVLTSVRWLPVVLMSLVILSAFLGVASLSVTVLVEILPLKIRSFGTTFCIVILSIFILIVLKLFPMLMVTTGLSTVMWIFASTNAFGCIFFLIILRETKGKNLNNDGA